MPGGATSRNKGRQGERELLNLLSKELNIPKLARNQNQTFDGGADCIELKPFAIEVKRCEDLKVAEWWKQAVGQARRINGSIPVLAYRKSRMDWQFVVPIGLLTGVSRPLDLEWCATVKLPAFIEICRENMLTEAVA